MSDEIGGYRKVSALTLASMGTDHVVRGGPGPLFGAGWAAACEHWSKKLLAESSPCEAEERELTLADLERQLKQAEFEKQAYTDALRYRWLRGMIFDDRIIVASDRMLHGDKLDAAIDAAMSAPTDTEESK